MLCKDNITTKNLMKEVIENEGEGLILRKVRSIYENGRSSSLVKLKVHFYKFFKMFLQIF